jgi:hypothetical protein
MGPPGIQITGAPSPDTWKESSVPSRAEKLGMTETCQQRQGGSSDLRCSSRRGKRHPDREGRGFDEAHIGCEASRFLSTDIAVETLTFAAGFSNMAPIALTPARVRRLSWGRV